VAAWVVPAILSAIFAAATAILAKIGVEDVNSNVATAIRTVVILVFAWGIVGAQGHLGDVTTLSRKTWVFLVLSGIATGLSWLFYFYALKIGPVARVATIDKASLAITILLSILILKEHANWQSLAGGALMIGGLLVASMR
jgi:transporter family protein